MIDVSVAPPVTLAGVPALETKSRVSAATDAGIDAYLVAGDGMASVMGLVMKVCVGLFVLIAIAWAFGFLPGAVKLF
jgi:hypothetical protein